MKRTIFLLTVLVVSGLASPALASPGDLDTTFGNNGTVVTRFLDGDGTPLFSPGDDLATQSDGRVIVAGGNFLARYNPTGTLDPSFDGDGKVISSAGSGGDLVIQPDGKIVVAGYVARRDSLGQPDFDFRVLRYNTDGSPDATFSGDGELTTSIGPDDAFDSAHGVDVQPDGKIVVVGYSHDYGTENTDIAVVRYNPDGSLDSTFDKDGKLTTSFGSGKDVATDIALRPQDGKIVIAGFSGHTTNENGVTTDDDFALVRYNSDGSLDSTFDTDGKLTTSFGSGKDSARALALQPNGKLVAAGASQHATEANGNPINDFAMARYNADGSLDASFDTDGKLTTAIGDQNDEATDLILQDDGKIVAAGRTATKEDGVGLQHNLALVRYNLDGSLDPLFHADGKVRGPKVNNQNVAAGLEASGKIFVSGTSTDQGQLLARFYGGDDATPPATSIVTNTNDSGAGSLRQAILDANDRTGADNIAFAIPDNPDVAGSEVKTISPDSPLPAITDPVTIDGYTQLGATPNTLMAKGTNAILKIELSGKDSPQGARGLMIRTSDSTIRGLVINRFDVNVQICDCTNPTVMERTNNRIVGNFIGTNPTGTAARGGGEVLLFQDAPGNYIGGASPEARNLISATEGFAAVDIRSSGNEIDGNLVGTTKDGKSPLGNRGTGLSISGNRADDNAVGLSATNIMAFNSEGVLIMGSGSGGNRILFNSVFNNLGPGIDLGGDNRTPNDSSDVDTGANGLQNFPVITSAKNIATTTVVKGKLNSIPNHSFVLQFFSNPEGSKGEGKNLVGNRVVTTDDKGDANFVLQSTPKVKEGLYVTATATNQSTGDTSEFSAPRAVVF